MEAKTEQPKKHHILDERRRKHLMKKLQKIKLNKSHGNNSLGDLGAFYETKFRKLQNNNICLAKALAEERQASQSWYDEVVSLKMELHEVHGKLQGYQLADNGNYDMAIEVALEKRIKEISDPLEIAVKSSLDNVLSLVENMTKVKQLASSIARTSRLSSYARTSRGSLVSRPPLSRTPKSPRKNVVHPMVEGHVLQPASIHLPRVTLEDRRRYRLQERAEIRQDQGLEMSVIGEQSLSFEERNSTASSSPSTPSQEEDEVLGATPEGTRRQSIVTPIIAQVASPEFSVTAEVPASEVPASEVSDTEVPATEEPEVPNAVCIVRPNFPPEDPLEGTSWMHLKKKRGRQCKKRKKPAVPVIRRSSGMHLLLESSSGSEEELPNTRKRTVCKPILSNHADINTPNSSPPDANDLPKLCLVRLEDFDSKVSKRSKKWSNGSSGELDARTGKKSLVNNNENLIDGKVVPRMLESFIVNDSFVEELNLNHDKKFVRPGLNSLINSPLKLISELSPYPIPTSPVKDSRNMTCLIDASMEMTECLSKDLLNMIKMAATPKRTNFDCQTLLNGNGSDNEAENHNICTKIQKCVSNGKKKACEKKEKPKRFFKDKPNVNGISNTQMGEKTPYDLSMMEVTANVGPYSLKKEEKENIPPEDENNSDGSMMLKDVTVVVEDIMKTPVSPEQVLDESQQKVTKNVKSRKSESSAKSTPSTLVNSKKRFKKTKKSLPNSPLRKVAKRRKLMNFAVLGIEADAISDSSAEDKSWSPDNKQMKTRGKIPKKSFATVAKRKRSKKNISGSPKEMLTPSEAPVIASNKPIKNASTDLTEIKLGLSIDTVEHVVAGDKNKQASTCLIEKTFNNINTNLPEGIEVPHEGNYSIQSLRDIHLAKHSDNNLASSHQVLPTNFNSVNAEEIIFAGEKNPKIVCVDNKDPNIELLDSEVDEEPEMDLKKPEMDLKKCKPKFKINEVYIIEEEELPRQRRAAAKTSSFKEPSLNSKLRRTETQHKKTKKKKI